MTFYFIPAQQLGYGHKQGRVVTQGEMEDYVNTFSKVISIRETTKTEIVYRVDGTEETTTYPILEVVTELTTKGHMNGKITNHTEIVTRYFECALKMDSGWEYSGEHMAERNGQRYMPYETWITKREIES